MEKGTIDRCILQIFDSKSQHKVTVYVTGRGNAGKTTFLSEIRVLLSQIYALISPDCDFNEAISFVDGYIPSLVSGGTHIVFYLYDICDGSALENFRKDKPFRQFSKSGVNAKCVLVGNKIDLEYWRKCDVKAGRAAAVFARSKFIEISCLTGQHLDFIADVILAEVFPSLTNTAIAAECVAAISAPKSPPKVRLTGWEGNEYETHLELLQSMEEQLSETSADEGIQSNTRRKNDKKKEMENMVQRRKKVKDIPSDSRSSTQRSGMSQARTHTLPPPPLPPPPPPPSPLKYIDDLMGGEVTLHTQLGSCNCVLDCCLVPVLSPPPSLLT